MLEVGFKQRMSDHISVHHVVLSPGFATSQSKIEQSEFSVSLRTSLPSLACIQFCIHSFKFFFLTDVTEEKMAKEEETGD
jgi:hypothetical protein